jgi:hypothetical protein
MQLNEKEFKLFKKWLKGHLALGPVTVTFTKKDGTERVMECTTSTELVPEEPLVENSAPKREKKANDDVCNVYALDVKAWRSFRWDGVKSVTFTIGEEIEHSNETQ